MLDVHFPGVVVVAVGSPSCALYRHQVVESAGKQEHRGPQGESGCFGAEPHPLVCVCEGHFILSLIPSFLQNWAEHLLCARTCAGGSSSRSDIRISSNLLESEAERAGRPKVRVMTTDDAGAPPRPPLTSGGASAQWFGCWLLLAHGCPLPGSCSVYRHRETKKKWKY